MRLWAKDADESEITGVYILSAKKRADIGGEMLFTLRDIDHANIAANQERFMQRVEVRKNDGSTFLWGGLIPTMSFRRKNIIHQAQEILRVLDRVKTRYNGILTAGVVTAISDPTITDGNQSWTADAYNGKYVMFEDKSPPTQELVYPNSDTTWYNDPAADDPADTETGSYTDLAIGGESNCMHIEDTSNRGSDYYGVMVSFTVPNALSSNLINVRLDFSFLPWMEYRDTGTYPIVQIYDETYNGGDYRPSTTAGLTNIGRLDALYPNIQAGSLLNDLVHIVQISSNYANYFDGSNKCKLRILSGLRNNDSTDIERIKVYFGELTNYYGSLFDASSTAYTVDDTTTTTLVTTGETPGSDGVSVGDTFRVGDLLENIMTNIWRNGAIHWADLSFAAASGKAEAVDYTHMSVGSVLRDFSERLNRRVFQNSWTITCPSSYTSTGYTLTEADFGENYSWDWYADDMTFANQFLSFSHTVWRPSSTYRFYTPFIKSFANPFIGNLTTIQQHETTINQRYQDAKRVFRCELDLETGSYNNIDVGKTISVAVDTDKITLTDGFIEEVEYTQSPGGRLMGKIGILEV